METASYCCPLFFSTLRFPGRPTGRGRSRPRVAASRARPPRYPDADLDPRHAGREAPIGRVGVDVRDEVILPGVAPSVRRRDGVVGHNNLFLCELTATAASTCYCRRGGCQRVSDLGGVSPGLDASSVGLTERPVGVPGSACPAEHTLARGQSMCRIDSSARSDSRFELNISVSNRLTWLPQVSLVDAACFSLVRPPTSPSPETRRLPPPTPTPVIPARPPASSNALGLAWLALTLQIVLAPWHGTSGGSGCDLPPTTKYTGSTSFSGLSCRT